MDYLDTILENAEYIDTVQGKLPLANAARLISQDKLKHHQLFNEIHVQKIRNDCYKRLLCIGFGFLCLFSSAFALRNLQSSLPGYDPTLGLITFGCLRLLTWFGGLIAASIVSKLRPKWTMVVGTIGFILYPMSNIYPVSYILIPCALMCSVSVGMVWGAEGVYMINLAATYAFVSQKSLMSVIGTFNGAVAMLFQSSHVLGNLLTSLLLSDQIQWFSPLSTLKGNATAPLVNLSTVYASTSISYDEADFWSANEGNTTSASYNVPLCGLEFYSIEQQLVGARNVDPRQYHLVFGVFIALSFIGFGFMLLLKPLKIVRTTGNNNIAFNMVRLLKTVVNPRILLLTPCVMGVGLSSSIVMADYTKVIVSNF